MILQLLHIFSNLLWKCYSNNNNKLSFSISNLHSLIKAWPFIVKIAEKFEKTFHIEHLLGQFIPSRKYAHVERRVKGLWSVPAGNDKNWICIIDFGVISWKYDVSIMHMRSPNVLTLYWRRIYGCRKWVSFMYYNRKLTADARACWKSSWIIDVESLFLASISLRSTSLFASYFLLVYVSAQCSIPTQIHH